MQSPLGPSQNRQKPQQSMCSDAKEVLLFALCATEVLPPARPLAEHPAVGLGLGLGVREAMPRRFDAVVAVVALEGDQAVLDAMYGHLSTRREGSPWPLQSQEQRPEGPP